MSTPSVSPTRHRHAAAFIVAAGAALWGLDGLFRQPLVLKFMPATQLVFAEHVLLVVATLPWSWRALKSASKLDLRGWIYLILIGVGGSAVATILFTKAFATGDGITPLVLQQVQPLVVVLAASVLLGERMHPKYFAYLSVAIVSVWLISFKGITFRHPLPGSLHGGKTAMFALSAAVLWALGTVLGRHLSTHLDFKELTTLRFVFGLVGAFICVMLDHQVRHSIVPPSSTFVRIIGLTLVTGLLAMLLYYYGLRRTPASIATIAELAFPITATIVGYLWLHSSLKGSQWIGVAALSATVVVLSWQSNAHVEEIVDVADDELLETTPAA